MPSKGELIARIRLINRSADDGWLARFPDQALLLYLKHLETLDQPRGTIWKRQGDTAAVVTRVR